MHKKEESTQPELTKLTEEQIVALEKNLANFISNVRINGGLPLRPSLDGHGSHAQN